MGFKRSKIPSRKSKKMFTRTARHVNPRNVRPVVMRGGIRF